MKDIKEFILSVILIILIIFLFIYLFFNGFRNCLSYLNIDPNFLVAFVALITLIFSIIGNRKERKYNFNLNLQKSVEEKAIIVIGKLFVIMNSSEIYLKTSQNIKRSIEEKNKFVDTNDIFSLNKNFNKDIELLGAYIEIYFKKFIENDWNLMQAKMNKIANNCLILLLNYNENYKIIDNQNFQNKTLSNIDKIIEESEGLNKEIYELTEKMKNSLLGVLINNNKKIKEKYL